MRPVATALFRMPSIIAVKVFFVNPSIQSGLLPSTYTMRGDTRVAEEGKFALLWDRTRCRRGSLGRTTTGREGPIASIPIILTYHRVALAEARRHAKENLDLPRVIFSASPSRAAGDGRRSLLLGYVSAMLITRVVPVRRQGFD